MSDEKKPLNEGYQPKEDRGYQPNSNGNFGYQPVNKSTTTPPPPPKSDTIASSPKKD